MKAFEVVFVMDDDERRRASLSYAVRKLGWASEIFSSLGELFVPSHARAALLVSDDMLHIRPEHVFARLEEFGAWMPSICYSQRADAAAIVRSLRAGALNYLVWPFEQSALLGALEQLATDATSLERAMIRRAEARKLLGLLTPREREVVEYVAAGHSNKEIAQRLTLSPRTIEIHRGNANAKLGGLRTADLARLWADASPEA